MSLRDTMRGFIRNATIRCGRGLGISSNSPRGYFIRIDVPGLYGHEKRALEITQCLGNIDGILDIRPNPATGRVLVQLPARDERQINTITRQLEAMADPFADSAPSFQRFTQQLRQTARKQATTFKKLRQPDKLLSSAEVPRDQPVWHALTVEEVCGHFIVCLEKGLRDPDVEEKRKAFGRNVLAGIQCRSTMDILREQLVTLPCALLFGAAGLSLLLGDVLEAGAIVLVIGSNIAIGYFSESRAEELLSAWGELRAEWAKVLRNGQEMRIAATEVVPGDILIVRAGDAIPADARLVESHDLFVDESMLTGESEPAEKNTLCLATNAPIAERRNMLFGGTIVVAGEGRAIVVATGQCTELGAIERALARAEIRTAPLERQLAFLGQRVALMAAASSAAIIVLGLLRGKPISILLRSAVALGVAAIPEGFPAVGTTALALASHRLKRDGLLIRRLVAAETLGAVQIVCADKTGTLTENKMRVQEVVLPVHGILRVVWSHSDKPEAQVLDDAGSIISTAELRDLLRIAALNADVVFDESANLAAGSGTERALVEFAIALGYPAPERRNSARRIRERRRSVDRAFMTTTHEHPDLGRIELIKGAPEQVLLLMGNLSESERQAVFIQNESLASRGLRVLAFGWRHEKWADNSNGFSFAGLIGLQDPPRIGVREAMATLARAGITTHMLTGDQHKTALAIGQLLGIPEKQVHSRVTPVDKLEIVQQLQTKGFLVAMTGDGVNDGPALKAADVGIAMGQRGTDIARAVADVVLARDDLPAIVTAIAEGRRLHDNVRRAIHYLAATNSSEVMTMLFGAALGITPLGPLQLLWVNILTDIAPALALAVEPADSDIMSRPPRNPDDQLFSPNDLRQLLRHATLMAAGALSSYGVGTVFGLNRRGAQTMAFLSLITSQILYTETCRAHSHQKDPALQYAIAASFLLQAAAFVIPELRRVLNIENLGPGALGTSLLVGALPALITRKRIRRHSATNSLVVLCSHRSPILDSATMNDNEMEKLDT